MIHYKHDGTDDGQSIVAGKPLMTEVADGLDAALAENKRLREALRKIYSEAMMVNEPPESTWYRIAGIADIALAREEAK